jgi:hypothetical protein
MLIAALAALAAAAPGPPATVDVDVPAAFAATLSGVKAKTIVPVLLPATMPYEDVKLYATGVGRSGSWHLDLATARDCRMATACFVAEFTARRGARPHGQRKVRLRGDRTGWFTPSACGASCGPPTIAWRQHGARYRIRAKVGTQDTERRILVRMANQAIRAGRR